MPPVLDEDTHSGRSICAGGCMACTFSSVSQAVKESKHISTHRPVTHSPPLVTLASPCSGAEASCGGRQLAGAVEGSNKPSLTSSSWRVKPRLLDLPSAPHRGRSSVAHTHTRHGHDGACRSSVLLVLTPRRPCQVSRPLHLPVLSPSGAFLTPRSPQTTIFTLIRARIPSTSSP